MDKHLTFSLTPSQAVTGNFGPETLRSRTIQFGPSAEVPYDTVPDRRKTGTLWTHVANMLCYVLLLIL